VKAAESELGSITAADGEIFAVRRALLDPLDERIINDDAELTFALVRKGYRVLYQPTARSWEMASLTIEDDFNVKVRMVAGGFQTIAMHWRMLLPPRSWFSIAFLSHKILRWIAPEILILLLLASALLMEQELYLFLLLGQVAFYGVAWYGWRRRQSGAMSMWVYIPYYFCAMNMAAFFGLGRFLRGRHTTLWQKARR
jgi:cellulose synthase/poly-beta-1,6-N-acetylglucosamine synthase-like glycosyltransferase